MRVTRSLACANTLILIGALVPAVVVGAALPMADVRGHFFAYSLGIVWLVPACTLAGTAWSGWLAVHEPRRGFWSRALFTVGIVLCVAEGFVAFSLPLMGV